MDQRTTQRLGAIRTRMLSTGEVTGCPICDDKGEKMGRLEELVLDATTGRVAYGILSFGGYPGIGDKYFAVPWLALRPDSRSNGFVLDVEKERLTKAPRFEGQNRPQFADPRWGDSIHEYYGFSSYWNWDG